MPQKDVLYAGTGTAAATFPWWNEAVAWFAGANQAVIGIGGLIIVVLTVLKVFTEYRIARRKLREMDKAGGE